ncbi:uncharacterized protein B0I36DRAFT_259264 [Microdochium trichocladiopsis]|uniref:Dicer-like protein 2 n=1 Tax=Microdochium trichocladiopsis TaxID=1682393 RepID=A0A9P9BZH3_9PEZI|nr:uncharacterized protein B0I36DRAFT_259264 [Microdochium trichocladiopsis]KAH7040109.1 hypothetical protein B0I36DRAFT_259264 [Microdochium trichocladiopsis]
MFELSLKQNIIVAMPTGSGKTQVAILRVRAEIERTPPDKISWFLAPTVALCQQQYAVFVQQTPAVSIKLLTGAIVDKWSDTKTWDDFLHGARVVISTYQLLYDAINHAFVHFDRLTLVVVDEAHNCRGKSPVVMIMKRYQEAKENGFSVPAILGLTASPIMNSRLDGIEKIESIMDAVCRTPTIHREELTNQVKLPEMQCVSYSAVPEPVPHSMHTPSMRNLQEIARLIQQDVFNDPEVLQLKRINDEKSREKLRTMLVKRDTYAITEIRTLVRKTHEVCRQLGPWAADRFIAEAISQYQGLLMNAPLGNGRDSKLYLSLWLHRVQAAPTGTGPLDFSEKVQRLAQVLLAGPSDTMGIVFVDQTATVTMLAHLLMQIPQLRARFRVGMMVGTSQSSKRTQGLGGFHRKLGDSQLEQFRLGSLNLLVATTVLEEGIDVPACNLVVCFDPPRNLKSFIQRRGRARKGTARLVLLFDDQADQDQHESWLELENEMKKRYQDDVKHVKELEDVEMPEVPPFRVPTTRAVLDFDQAISHLQHICTHLSTRPDAASTPYYLIHRTESSMSRQSQITATVVLPASLPDQLRRFKSENSWYAEKNAKKDAAFVAFKALYEAGLVDDNLMPLRARLDASMPEVRPGMTDAKECFNPWVEIAHAWTSQPTPPIFSRKLRLLDANSELINEAILSIPKDFPDIPGFPLYWDQNTTWTVRLDEIVDEDVYMGADQDQSRPILDVAFGHRFIMQELQHIVHIRLVSDRQLSLTLKNEPVAVTAQIIQSPQCSQYLIRDEHNSPFFFSSWLSQITEPDCNTGKAKKYVELHADQPWLVLQKWPKNVNFLGPSGSTPPKRPTFRPVVTCRQDTIPFKTIQLGAILPSVFHMMETHLIAQKLSTGLLAGTGLSDLSLIVTAISSSHANKEANYQRLEFLGDTILKFLTTVTLCAIRPNFPEGYLTLEKSSIVSNAHLCNATLRSGLDEYILTEPFTGRKWTPKYVEDLTGSSEATEPRTRSVSTKTLADVVESLAGAAYIEGGWESATKYLRKMLPEVNLHTPDDARTILQSHRPVSHELSSPLAPLETLCGYRFKNKTLLVEAMTHTSFSAFAEPPPDSSTSPAAATIAAATRCASLERLEFLGDAILDTIVVQCLWHATDRSKPLSHQKMHLLRTTVVNADLLGFLAMEWSITQERSDISPTDPAKIITKPSQLPLWKFMRHSNPALGLKQQVAEHRHRQGRDFIWRALFETSGTTTTPTTTTTTNTTTTYPWAELAHLHIPKTFSDLVEALIGAVWTDSGSLEQCAAVAERIGILPLLRRLVADGVDVMHPKNKLGEFIRDRKVRYEVDVHGGSAGGGGADTMETPAPILDLLVQDGEEGETPSTTVNDDDDNTPTNPAPELSMSPPPPPPSLSPDLEIPAAVQAHINRADQYTCNVFVDEELIVQVGGGLGREEIITKAADKAYSVLLARWGASGPPRTSPKRQ